MRWIDYDNCALCSNIHSVLDLQHQKKKKNEKKKKHAETLLHSAQLVPHHGLKDLTAETFCHF